MSSVTINGEAHALANDADALLVDVLRDGIGLTGTKDPMRNKRIGTM